MNMRASVILQYAIILFSLFFASLPVPPAAGETGETGSEKAGSGQVTFNFVDVDLSTLTKFISEVTGKNFIFDERVKGKITIIAPTKLNIDEAFDLYTSILELKGFTVVPSGVNAYKIISTIEARQKGIEISSDIIPVNESFVARLITLKNISSEDALRLTQPLISRHGYVSSFGPGNMLLVIDSGLNIDKILSIIDAVDKPSVKEDPEIVFLEHASAEAVIKILNEGSGSVAPQGNKGTATQAKGGRAVADLRLNAVILFGDKREKASMKSLIATLDVPAPSAHGRINVYFLENADAAELEKVMKGILEGGRTQQQTVKGSVPVTPFKAAGDITVTADEATNALIIVASPSDYRNLVEVIKQLDRRRRQVFVEAMIVEASIDRLRELGTRWRVVATDDDEPVAIGGFRSVDPTAIQDLIFGLTGLTGGGLGNFLDVPVNTLDPETGEITQSVLNIPGYAALFNIDEFEGIINVLSTPQILTSDNQEAEIHVGENVPFVSQRERDVTTTNTVLSSIERTDVGIILNITPQITEGDYVRLEIFQEISAVKPEPNEDIIINVGPTTTKRSTRTSVVVNDGQTVVISGLIQEREDDNSTKIPLLGDIPILGWLFKTESVSRKKTNLLVFITPHIIKDSENLQHITTRKKKEFARHENQYVEGELLVKFYDGVPDERAREIIAENGASLIRVIDGINVYHIMLGKKQEVEEAVKIFSSLPEVEYAEPNYRMSIEKDESRMKDMQ